MCLRHPPRREGVSLAARKCACGTNKQPLALTEQGADIVQRYGKRQDRQCCGTKSNHALLSLGQVTTRV